MAYSSKLIAVGTRGYRWEVLKDGNPHAASGVVAGTGEPYLFDTADDAEAAAIATVGVTEWGTPTTESAYPVTGDDIDPEADVQVRSMNVTSDVSIDGDVLIERTLTVAEFVDLGSVGTGGAVADAPGANVGRLFVRENVGGKDQLCVRFASGATQVIATEP